MENIFLGLGSNLGDRMKNLEMAVELLQASGIKVVNKSDVYETEPVGEKNQEWFLNQVVEVHTDLSPENLLQEAKKIEKKMGRKKTIKWGPRVIDIDILFYDGRVIHQENLVIPHARYRDRRFVLEPLNDLDPLLRDPETGESMADLLNRCCDTAIVKPLF